MTKSTALETEIDIESWPIAEVQPYPTDESSKNQTLSYDYAASKKDTHTMGGAYTTTASSSGYWGRFDVAEASESATLVSGDNDEIPVVQARPDDRRERQLFIRKVYLILMAQLTVTFLACAGTMHTESIRNFVLGPLGMGFYYMNIMGLLVLICFLSKYKRSYPTNAILLSLFTLSTSFMLAQITAIYAEAGAEDLVLEAMFITATVFVVLTCFTLNSKLDFSFLGAGLGAALWIMILWGLAAMIFGVQTGFVYGLGGSILFSLFIVYDTYLLAERHDPQDYIIAAVELYLDIINLFLYILQMLSDRR